MVEPAGRQHRHRGDLVPRPGGDRRSHHGQLRIRQCDGRHYGGRAGAEGQSFNLLLFGAASTVVFSLIAQIGEQVDFLRFLPPRSAGRPAAWWTAFLAAGPGWILPGLMKLLAGSFLAYLAV